MRKMLFFFLSFYENMPGNVLAFCRKHENQTFFSFFLSFEKRN